MQNQACLKRNGMGLPYLAEEDSRYIVAENGIFLQRHSSMFTSCARISRYDLELQNHHQYCDLRCGKISRVMHRAMLGFFKRAHDIHGGEAALVLLFHPEKRMFRWHCPEQTVELFRVFSGWMTRDTIEFDNPLDLPDGYLQFGDAHLHPGSPHPSIMDMDDDQDGLHIIVGDINKTPRYHVDFVIDETRFRVAPELIFEDADCTPYENVPKAWMKKIHLRRIQRTSKTS